MGTANAVDPDRCVSLQVCRGRQKISACGGSKIRTGCVSLIDIIRQGALNLRQTALMLVIFVTNFLTRFSFVSIGNWLA